MAIRIKDIATRVGVSRGTVDRVIHKRGNVAPHLKQKIENAIVELGYHSNIIASQLVSNKPLSIGVILPHFSEDSYWTLPIQGIHDCMTDYGHFNIKIKTVYFNLVNAQSFIDACQSKELTDIDAVILASVYTEKEAESQAIFKHRSIPIVAINTDSRHANTYPVNVSQESYQAGRVAGSLFNLSIQEKPSILKLTIGQLAYETIHVNQRQKGLHDYFREKNVSFSTLDIPNLSDTEQLADKIMTHIDKHGPFNGVFIGNSKAYRFVDALKQKQRNFTSIGFDLSEENIVCLKQNALSFIIDLDPIQQGYTAMKLLVESLILNKPLSKMHKTGIKIIVKENIEG